MRARCTVYPSEAPERLGLKVVQGKGLQRQEATVNKIVEDHGLVPECSEPNLYGSGCWIPESLFVL